MNFLRLVSNFVVIFVFLIILNNSVIAGKSADSGIYFDKAKNTLSVRLNDANIAEIAEILSRKTGINVFLDKSIARPITSAFQNEPIEAGIKRLLGPDISSAFIFVKEAPPSGEVIYRLDTVKIFIKGNMLSADFKRFEKGIPKEKASETSDIVHPKRHLTPGIIAHEIMKARKNIEMLHMKEQIETKRVRKRIIGLNMKLSRNPSPEERVELVRQLNQAQQSLGMVKSLNSQLIINEEQNVKELIQEKTNLENKEKFIERQRESDRYKSP